MDLTVRELRVASRSGASLLDIQSLDIGAGGAVGIRGASGAGKSTLLKAIMGLTAHTTGRVHWDDTDILSLSGHARATFRRRHIGMVFQDFLLFDELGASGNAAIQASFSPPSERAGLRDRAKALLNGSDITDTDRPVASFSGGERQRVAVARALAHDPQVVLADEPTASLPRDAGDALTDALLFRVRDRHATLIVVSHDLRLLDRMDRVVTLDHGTLAKETA